MYNSKRLRQIIIIIMLLGCAVFSASQAKECKDNHWCYQAEFPFLYNINDVKKLGNDLFAVGNSGALLFLSVAGLLSH